MKYHSSLSHLSIQIRWFLRLRLAWRMRKTSTSTCTIYAEKSWYEHVSTCTNFLFFCHFCTILLKCTDSEILVFYIADQSILATNYMPLVGIFQITGQLKRIRVLHVFKDYRVQGHASCMRLASVLQGSLRSQIQDPFCSLPQKVFHQYSPQVVFGSGISIFQCYSDLMTFAFHS